MLPAAGRLQEAGLIRYSRGRIVVVDRTGLVQRSCECYETIKEEYDRLLTKPIPHYPAARRSRVFHENEGVRLHRVRFARCVRQRTERRTGTDYRSDLIGEHRVRSMEITVYSCGDNELVIVPTCLQPSVEALSRLGPLMPCGSATVIDEPTTHSWAWVVAEMERRSYAVVSRSDARRLLGSGHPALRPRRRVRNGAVAPKA
ncbi:hypothetical protein [Luteimonas sp. R10]|uniref:hypothetical protein n=1 Tax=Luteimonas sp. R10 TaxID=3108176 RepID=UPI003088BF39|nr:hypothetical protein U3649_17250 [Luteimonas sp. R10]